MWVTACFCAQFIVVSLHFCSELSIRTVFILFLVCSLSEMENMKYTLEKCSAYTICLCVCVFHERHAAHATLPPKKNNHKKQQQQQKPKKKKNLTTWTQKSTRNADPAYAILCATDTKRNDNRRANMWMKNIFASKGDVLIVDHVYSVPPNDRQSKREKYSSNCENFC